PPSLPWSIRFSWSAAACRRFSLVAHPPIRSPEAILILPNPNLAFRRERPGLLLRAAFWRVGPRSGGIVPQSSVAQSLLSLLFIFSVTSASSAQFFVFLCSGLLLSLRSLCSSLCELCVTAPLLPFLSTFNFQLLTLNSSF